MISCSLGNVVDSLWKSAQEIITSDDTFQTLISIPNCIYPKYLERSAANSVDSDQRCRLIRTV